MFPGLSGPSVWGRRCVDGSRGGGVGDELPMAPALLLNENANRSDAPLPSHGQSRISTCEEVWARPDAANHVDTSKGGREWA